MTCTHEQETKYKRIVVEWNTCLLYEPDTGFICLLSKLITLYHDLSRSCQTFFWCFMFLIFFSRKIWHSPFHVSIRTDKEFLNSFKRKMCLFPFMFLISWGNMQRNKGNMIPFSFGKYKKPFVCFVRNMKGKISYFLWEKCEKHETYYLRTWDFSQIFQTKHFYYFFGDIQETFFWIMFPRDTFISARSVWPLLILSLTFKLEFHGKSILPIIAPICSNCSFTTL